MTIPCILVASVQPRVMNLYNVQTLIASNSPRSLGGSAVVPEHTRLHNVEQCYDRNLLYFQSISLLTCRVLLPRHITYGLKISRSSEIQRPEGDAMDLWQLGRK